jgi:glycosyltransferase involved in cell wall biosynthesis
MNIVYINKSWTKKIPDGIATYTKTIAGLMASRGHQVHIITLFDVNLRSKSPGLVFHLVKTYIPGSWLKFRIFQIIETFIFQLGAYGRYRSIAKEIDVLEAPDAAAEGFFVALLGGRKLVTRLHTPLLLCTVLNGQRPGIGRNILGWMEHLQVSRSRNISCPSKILSKKISEIWKLPGKITIIPNPLGPIIKTTKKYRHSDFIFIGGFDVDEGLKRFQAAFINLRRNFPNLTACAVGKFKVPEDKLKMPGIMYLGVVDQAELFGRMKNADTIVFSARWENFPYALQEARILKKISVCPNVGGYAELVKDGFDGWLYNIDSKNGLFLKMKHCFDLSKEVRERIGKRAYKNARQYTSPNLVAKFEKYYLASRKNGD